MKQFFCGDIVPGCTEQYQLATEDEILAVVARHARDDHGLDPIPDELVASVRAHIRSVDE